MTTKEKIKKYIDSKGISKNKFYTITGFSSTFLDSGNTIGVDKAKIIIEKFPDISMDWLMLDKGPMLKNDPDLSDGISKPPNYSLVPLYNMDARGGFGSNNEVDTVECIEDYIPFKDAKKGDICVPVSGKSMIPTYYPGSIVLLHEIECWREFIEMGYVYVVILNDGRRLLKELRHSVEDRKQYLLCVSHNPEIEPVELPRNLIARVYMVTALYQKMTM